MTTTTDATSPVKYAWQKTKFALRKALGEMTILESRAWACETIRILRRLGMTNKEIRDVRFDLCDPWL